MKAKEATITLKVGNYSPTRYIFQSLMPNQTYHVVIETSAYTKIEDLLKPNDRMIQGIRRKIIALNHNLKEIDKRIATEKKYSSYFFDLKNRKICIENSILEYFKLIEEIKANGIKMNTNQINFIRNPNESDEIFFANVMKYWNQNIQYDIIINENMSLDNRTLEKLNLYFPDINVSFYLKGQLNSISKFDLADIIIFLNQTNQKIMSHSQMTSLEAFTYIYDLVNLTNLPFKSNLFLELLQANGLNGTLVTLKGLEVEDKQISTMLRHNIVVSYIEDMTYHVSGYYFFDPEWEQKNQFNLFAKTGQEMEMRQDAIWIERNTINKQMTYDNRFKNIQKDSRKISEETLSLLQRTTLKMESDDSSYENLENHKVLAIIK